MYVTVVAAPARYDAVTANDADVAVPCNEPVIPAVTSSEPVILDDPSEKNPFIMRNSFAIAFPYPSWFIINMIILQNVLE